MSEQNSPTGADVLIPVTTILALSFVAVAVPLQFSREWVELGWISVACLLWFFSCRIGDKTFTIMSATFFLLGGIQFLVVDLLPIIAYKNIIIESFYPAWSTVNWVGLAFAWILILTTLGTQAFLKRKLSAERIGITQSIGVIGLVLFWFLSTMEIFHYFYIRTWILHVSLISAVGLSLYWVFFARTLQVIAFAVKSETFRRELVLVRLCSVYLFFLTIVKIAVIDIWRKPLDIVIPEFWTIRPDYAIPVWNFYAVGILAASGVLIAASIHAQRSSVLQTFAKKLPYKCIGLAGLAYIWLVLSIECYYFFELRTFTENHFLAVCSLTYLWTLFGFIVFGIGVWKNAYVLRAVTLMIFLITSLKSLALDLPQRPEYYEIPFANPYALSVILLAGVIFFIGIWTNRSRSERVIRLPEERTAATALGVFALAILWLLVSWETYLYFAKNAEDIFLRHWFDPRYYDLRYAPVTLLSVIWSVFGMILFSLGMKGNSAVLRYFGCCVFTLVAIKAILYDFTQRPENFPTPLFNPFGLPMLCVVLMLFLAGIWATRFKPPLAKEERTATTILGLLGILILWLGLSAECFCYFNFRPETFPEARFLSLSSLSVLWTALATVLMVIGIRVNSLVLRTAGLVVFLFTACKVVLIDMTQRPESYLTPFWNPFALPSLTVVLALIVFAVWSTRIRPAEMKEERNVLAGTGILGILMLWVLLSIETSSGFLLQETLDSSVKQHLASTSVSTVWLFFAVVVFATAISCRSELLRYTAIVLTVIVVFRVVFENLLYRPDYYDPFWTPLYIPVLNTYMVPLLLLSVYLMIVGIIGYHRLSAFLFETTLDKKVRNKYMAERDIYMTFAFCGLAILLISSSIECFRAFNSDRVPENVQVAQMSLSILWSVFGGILMFIGFRWKSSILRWCAIILLILTTSKVFLIDLASIQEVYRIGAFFALAVVLWLAARAYQRFRPGE